MKSILSLDKTSYALERSCKASTKLELRKLPTDIEMESIPSGGSFVFGGRYSGENTGSITEY